jgi:hypothetical protein
MNKKHFLQPHACIETSGGVHWYITKRVATIIGIEAGLSCIVNEVPTLTRAEHFFGSFNGIDL